METFKVNLLDLDKPVFFQEAEKYAFFYSKEFKKFFDKSMKDVDDTKDLEGYLELSANRRKVYRRFHGWHVSSGIVQLTYRTMCELKVSQNEEVLVKNSNWFKFYYYNSDSGTKWPFRIGLYSLLFAIVSIIIALFQSFFCCL